MAPAAASPHAGGGGATVYDWGTFFARKVHRDGIDLLPVADALADPTSMLTAPNETA